MQGFGDMLFVMNMWLKCTGLSIASWMERNKKEKKQVVFMTDMNYTSKYIAKMQCEYMHKIRSNRMSTSQEVDPPRSQCVSSWYILTKHMYSISTSDGCIL